MHELSLALDLVEKIEKIAKQENARAVTEVEVLIGKSSGIDADSFAFAFPEAARDTLVADARLSIQTGDHREFQLISMEVLDV